jgi:hypothetical protein
MKSLPVVFAIVLALTVRQSNAQTNSIKPVEIPAWLQDTIGVGYTLSGMNTSQRSEAVKHGVTISEMNFVDPFYPYYDSQLLIKRSPHVALDRLQQEIAEYKKLGVRILAVYPPTLQGEVYEAHPDWRRIPTDTTTIPQVDMKQFGHGGMLCPLGPYGDFFIDVLVEILEKHPDVDAFSFDGLHYGGVCYCEHCRHNFRNDTGKSIPPTDLNDPEFRRYQHWADRRLEALVQRMQTRLKKIKPDVALVTWTTNAGRFGHFLSVPRNMPARMNLLLDAPDQELWLDESNRGNSIVPAFGVAYAWAVTNHRVAFSEPYLMSHGNPYGKDSFPAPEILRRMLLCATYGCSPSIAVAQPPRMQRDVFNCLDEVQKRKPWLTHKSPEPWAALVMSDNTKTFYGRSSGKVEERYLAHVFGAFRACVEEHLPTTMIEDWNLTSDELKKYAVLVLPNTACLDDSQLKAIKDYVQNGGGLVATLDTSLFNEFGDPRPNFGLADVFGVDYRGLPDSAISNEEIDVNFAKSIGPDYWEKRRNIFAAQLSPKSFLLENQKLATYVGSDPVTFKGPAVLVKPHSEATIIGTVQELGPEKTPLPAIFARPHGKGRVVYLAAGFDAAYYQYSYPYQRLLLKESIAWAAGNIEQPVRVEAPMCVHSTVMRQVKDDGQRLIVHLFNNVNTTGGHAFPNDDVPLREESLPIHNLRVTFRAGTKLKSVRLQPEDLPLEMTSTTSGISVIVPQLDVHSMVVAELAD